MRKLGIAIIGAGAIAGVHIDAYGLYPERCEVRAVCDIYREKAEQLIAEKGLQNATAYADYQQALQREDIDAVSICLPPSMHAPMSVDSLRAGKHVICEKPMAGSLEECDEMIAAARESGKLLCIVAQNRFKSPHMKLKRLLDEGAIGRVQFATVNSLWWRGENYYDIWWRGTWQKESGGCVTNHAVHHIDLLQWMVGMPERVMAVIGNVGHHNSECEDVGMAVMQYPEMFAQLTASIVTHSEAQELIFQGEKASVAVPWQVVASKPLPNGFPENNPEVAAAIERRYRELPELEREGHPAQIENFLKAIAGEASLLVDGTEARKTIELITAIYASSLRGTFVDLPVQPDNPLYAKGGIAAHMPHFHEKTKSIDNFEKTKPITLGRDVGK